MIPVLEGQDPTRSPFASRTPCTRQCQDCLRPKHVSLETRERCQPVSAGPWIHPRRCSMVPAALPAAVSIGCLHHPRAESTSSAPSPLPFSLPYTYPPLSPLLLSTTGKEQVIAPSFLTLKKVSISPVHGSHSEHILSEAALHQEQAPLESRVAALHKAAGGDGMCM